MSNQAKTSLWRLATPCLSLSSLLLVGSTLILIGCGQKGALYHPTDTSHKQPATIQPATIQQDKPCEENDCKQQ